jgi:CRISPR/Cas system CSM-associated protein Csm2 small subunit
MLLPWQSYLFVNERIIQLRYKLQRGYLTLLAAYAPEEGKPEHTEEFYETLQDQIDKINKNDTLSLLEIIMQSLKNSY